MGMEGKVVELAAGPAAAEGAVPDRAVIRNLINSLETKGIRYCHWKSNIRLEETLSGAEDIDLLVRRRDAALFHAALLENGFKLAPSRSGIGHPGVFHALALDEANADLVHVHAYFQIVSGDSLVKTYRFPVEDKLLERTRMLHGVRVPAPEAELVLFALRIALKHVSPVETILANRGYRAVARELLWLREAADPEAAERLCAEWFPTVGRSLFRQLLDAIAADRAVGRRVILGWQVAWRLRGLRRLGRARSAASRARRVATLAFGRFRRRRDMAVDTGGMIVALMGPKATGKSTLSDALAARLGRHLDVWRIHPGKPPATLLTALPHLVIPLARILFPDHRPREYEKTERRQAKRYSLLYVLRMTMLAYEQRALLRRALRSATAGTIVVADRYPSETTGAIDSSCFDKAAVANAGSALKRWLMRNERMLHRSLPRPGLVVQLSAPLETAIARDASRVKPGGPDSAAVERRWAIETQARFSGTPLVLVDTGRPLEETIRTVLRKVWRSL